jgi:hypothetical protein
MDRASLAAAGGVNGIPPGCRRAGVRVLGSRGRRPPPGRRRNAARCARFPGPRRGSTIKALPPSFVQFVYFVTRAARWLVVVHRVGGYQYELNEKRYLYRLSPLPCGLHDPTFRADAGAGYE